MKTNLSQAVLEISITALKVHPRNTEFFDEIQGEEYERFKKSIDEDGLLSPLVVSSDMTVISGHQRLKACKDLGYQAVPVIFSSNLKDEDEKLKKLIAANFGRSKNDPIKQSKLLKEYEKLRGVRQGSARQKVEPNNSAQVTQEDIAKELGVSVDTVQNLKRLSTIIPELQEIISNGNITPTTGFKLIARLSEDAQKELFESLPVGQKLTQSQMQQYIDEIQGLENQIKGYQMKLDKAGSSSAQVAMQAAQTQALSDLEAQLKEKELEIESLKSQEPKTVEVVPDDYEELKQRDAKRLDQIRELSSRADQAERKLLDNEFIQENKKDVKQIDFEYDYDFFEKVVVDFQRYINPYMYMELIFKEMPQEERNRFLTLANRAIDDLNEIVDALEPAAQLEKSAFEQAVKEMESDTDWLTRLKDDEPTQKTKDDNTDDLPESIKLSQQMAAQEQENNTDCLRGANRENEETAITEIDPPEKLEKMFQRNTLEKPLSTLYLINSDIPRSNFYKSLEQDLGLCDNGKLLISYENYKVFMIEYDPDKHARTKARIAKIKKQMESA